jgi:NADPH:quinone reductase-like Zn-dependent oxidoreductase
MKAVVQSGFGPAADVLSVQDVDRPTIGPADVLVRVEAVGVAKGNWLITRGLPYIARPSYGLRRPKHPVAGLQFSGTIEAMGDEVDGFSVGDPVFGSHPGALAEFVGVPAEALAAKPAGVTVEQAATVPISGVAALQAVRDGGRVQPGHRVLVIGASGGVGSFVTQIAKAFGAEVTGVASTRNVALVRDLGADRVIDYTREDPTAGDPKYDVIIDIAGNRSVARLRNALAPDGALVIVGGTGGRWTMGFGRTVGAMLLAPFIRHRIVGLLSASNGPDVRALAELMASGRVTPVVQTSYPLSRTAEAVEAVGAGRGIGTPVVTPTG